MVIFITRMLSRTRMLYFVIYSFNDAPVILCSHARGTKSAVLFALRGCRSSNLVRYVVADMF